MFELIKSCNKERTLLAEPIIWRFLYQIAQGLKYLHDKSIIHRDIKGANILLNKDRSVAMLGDMNVSKVAKGQFLFTQTGTPYYASPEVWRDEPYDYRSDIWSLGCLIYELCALMPPFRGKDMQALFNKVQSYTTVIAEENSPGYLKYILMIWPIWWLLCLKYIQLQGQTASLL